MRLVLLLEPVPLRNLRSLRPGEVVTNPTRIALTFYRLLFVWPYEYGLRFGYWLTRYERTHR